MALVAVRGLLGGSETQAEAFWAVDHPRLGGVPSVALAQGEGFDVITPRVESQSKF